MSDKENNEIFFEMLAKVLLRSCILGIALMLLWFIIFLVADDWAYSIHSKWIEITKHDFDLLNYYCMAFFKMSIFLLFLIPYLSVRLTLRKKKEIHQ